MVNVLEMYIWTNQENEERIDILTIPREENVWKNIFIGTIKMITEQILSIQWANEFLNEQIELFTEILILILSKLLFYWANK